MYILIIKCIPCSQLYLIVHGVGEGSKHTQSLAVSHSTSTHYCIKCECVCPSARQHLRWQWHQHPCRGVRPDEIGSQSHSIDSYCHQTGTQTYALGWQSHCKSISEQPDVKTITIRKKQTKIVNLDDREHELQWNVTTALQYAVLEAKSTIRLRRDNGRKSRTTTGADGAEMPVPSALTITCRRYTAVPYSTWGHGEELIREKHTKRANSKTDTKRVNSKTDTSHNEKQRTDEHSLKITSPIHFDWDVWNKYIATRWRMHLHR